MTTVPDAPQDPEDLDDLKDIARERIEEMPAETALGNRDPEGGGEGDPRDYPGDGNG
jgi:hypothetical protein